MYLQNKYTKWYESIIAQAQQRVNQEAYVETHHIIPKSLGGTNSLDNLVALTAKEHFICHRLLPKMTTGKAKHSMSYAVWQMTMLSNRPRHTITSRTYDALKKQLSESRKGIPLSEETKQKMRKPKSEEHKKNISNAKKNPSESTRLKLSLARTAQTGLQKRSEDTKLKMSAWQKGIPKPTVACEHCAKLVSKLNHIRWHGNNCKFKDTSNNDCQ